MLVSEPPSDDPKFFKARPSPTTGDGRTSTKRRHAKVPWELSWSIRRRCPEKQQFRHQAMRHPARKLGKHARVIPCADQDEHDEERDSDHRGRGVRSRTRASQARRANGSIAARWTPRTTRCAAAGRHATTGNTTKGAASQNAATAPANRRGSFACAVDENPEVTMRQRHRSRSVWRGTPIHRSRSAQSRRDARAIDVRAEPEKDSPQHGQVAHREPPGIVPNR